METEYTPILRSNELPHAIFQAQAVRRITSQDYRLSPDSRFENHVKASLKIEEYIASIKENHDTMAEFFNALIKPVIDAPGVGNMVMCSINSHAHDGILGILRKEYVQEIEPGLSLYAMVTDRSSTIGHVSHVLPKCLAITTVFVSKGGETFRLEYSYPTDRIDPVITSDYQIAANSRCEGVVNPSLKSSYMAGPTGTSINLVYWLKRLGFKTTYDKYMEILSKDLTFMKAKNRVDQILAMVGDKDVTCTSHYCPPSNPDDVKIASTLAHVQIFNYSGPSSPSVNDVTEVFESIIKTTNAEPDSGLGKTPRKNGMYRFTLPGDDPCEATISKPTKSHNSTQITLFG